MKRYSVICIHIGARAHYLLPKALETSGTLHTLITDTWIGSAFLRWFLGMVPVRMVRSLAGRYISSIPSSKVKDLGFCFLLYDFYLRMKHSYSWSLIAARDRQFEKKAAGKLSRINDGQSVFAISYTALECFKIARQKKMKTILFQIDPGLEEENVVQELLKSSQTATDWEPAPISYWQRWKEECDLADVIMVNSLWSKDGLVKQGIGAEKIKIIPLPFTIENKHGQFQRSYPVVFSRERPLRCLFLGTIALRKGIHILLEAARELTALPVEFTIVGRSEIELTDVIPPNVHYKGLVTREETEHYYQQADIFLFPTLSDGFGLTQLEAMAWKLPVLSTKKCGDVVEQNINGWLIDPVNTHELTAQLKTLLANPAQIQNCSGNCLGTVKKFSMEKFTADIAAIV